MKRRNRTLEVVLAVSLSACFASTLLGGDIGFLVDPDEVVDMTFDQFWVQRLEDQGHNVSILPANYQPDNPGAVTADVFIASNDIGSGDFISNPSAARQLNFNPIDLTGHSGVEVNVLMAARPEGFDVDIDFLKFRADDDGDGNYETVLAEFLPTEFGELQQIGGEEVVLDELFQEVTFSVPESLSTLRLQLDPFSTATGEQFGIDNVRVTAGGTTLGSETFEGGAGQLGYTTVGEAVGGANQFFGLSNVEGLTPDVTFDDFEGDVWFGGADVDESFGFSATFRLTDPRPFITYEDAVFDELQMANDPATGRNTGDVIEIVDPDHPLAAGLKGDEFGEVFIYDGEQGITFLGPPDQLADDVDVVAIDIDGNAVIAVLEKDKIGLNGEPSPGLRIGIFPQDGGDGSLYTEDGLKLLDAAVEYALANVVEDILGDCSGDGALGSDDLACVTTVEERDAVLASIPALAGDLDGSGAVDFADFLVLSTNFNQALPGYTDGNINLEGSIDFADFLVLSTNFNQVPAAAAVPEPTNMLLLGMGGVLLYCLRRSRSGTDSV